MVFVLIKLRPSKIRFMHKTINSNFSDGKSVNETVEKISSGEMSVNDLPKIKVTKKNGFYYSFDNRRLYVYRVLELRGLLDTVEVKKAPVRFFQEERFTTDNNGRCVRLAVGPTLPHASAESPASSSSDEDWSSESDVDSPYYYEDFGIDYDDTYNHYDDLNDYLTELHLGDDYDER
ncbi:uncharacterized protein LOC143462702 [Clavelina lepadiformis]|uniref:uncharacterized protein LOC143462702 n=1 Tax=Clavelina lepadiformis TaxID=159417 RepID=UPI0040434743